MAPYTKPETVLRRSEELLSVNQPMSALASISEIFSSKRFRQTPLSSLEPIMLRFIDLCVLLRKTRTVKEGLHMYKNVAQNTSVNSVEIVIQHFISKSREKLTEALNKVDEIEGPLVKQDETGAESKVPIEVVDDLEATETPESLLLSTVSEEKSRDRTYRELVTPWLRSLWEAYRIALDILRNNARLENVYQQIATEAFEFCLTHTRKTEFRRLAETLRSNLTSSQKYANQAHSINLSDPEVLQRHLDTRFLQLNTSVKLELWQESFRTAEDINGLIGLSKKVPKNNVMSSFYEKMIKVFGVGENYLFHAAAYNKYYAIQSHTLVDQPEKLEKLASLVLLSALAVPIVNTNTGSTDVAKKAREGEEDSSSLSKTKSGRLASLLGLTSLPTRMNLLKDTILRGTLKKSSVDIQALYDILEVDFHPLSITRKIQPILERLAADTETVRYVQPLKEVVMTRLFQQLSQVYDSLKLTRIVKLASFGNTEPEHLNQTRIKVEKFLMEASKRGELEITLDHSSESIKFADRMFENGNNNQMSANHFIADPPSLFGLTDGVPVPSQVQATSGVLQPNSATLLRTHLTRLASALSISLKHISPTLSATTMDLNQVKSVAVQVLQTEGPKQRKMLLKRKLIIEERKRKVEEQRQKQDQEQAKAKVLRLIQIQEEQQARVQKQNKEREMKKLKDEADKIRAAEAEKVAIALAAQAGLSVDLKQLKGVDTNTIIQMGVEQIEKDKKELASKLKTVNKRLDHTERALRREEIPVLKEDYRLQQIHDEANFTKLQTELITSLKNKHAEELIMKKNFESMLPDFLSFKESVANKRGHDYKKAEEEARVKIEKAKAERLETVLRERRELKAKQREEKRLQAEQDEIERIRELEDARLEEERKLKQAEIEEQERQFKAEAQAKAQAAREERERERAAANESARKQAAREEEALAKREGKRLPERTVSSSTPQSQSPAGQTWRRTGAGVTASTDTAATPPASSLPPAVSVLNSGNSTRPTDPTRPSLPSTTSTANTTRPAADGIRPGLVGTRQESEVRPSLLVGLQKAGGWRERAAKAAEAQQQGSPGGGGGAGRDSPSGGSGGGKDSPSMMSRTNSNTGVTRTAAAGDSPKPNNKDEGGEWNEVAPAKAAYRPPQSRTNSNAPSGGHGGMGRTTSSRGNTRW